MSERLVSAVTPKALAPQERAFRPDGLLTIRSSPRTSNPNRTAASVAKPAQEHYGRPATASRRTGVMLIGSRS